MKKKVLIFTYYWPPAGGVAVQRFLKFSKYLPDYGWEPVIITVANGSYPYYDESLLKEVSPDLQVYRTKTFEPFAWYNLLRGKKGKSMPVVAVGEQGHKSFFQKAAEYIRANYFIPDARKGWVPYALAEAEKLMKDGPIEAIITTGPPHSTHLIGLALKKKFGMPWVADFRDPWTEIFYNDMLPRTRKAKANDKALETEVLKHADVVTVISSGMKARFEQRACRVEVLYNGYDDAVFAKPPAAVLPEKDFLFTYTGNLLASQDVPQLWNAIAALREECPAVKLLLIGRVDEQVKQSIARAGISDQVIYKDFMPHQEAIQYMWHSGMLLFLLARVKDRQLLMTGKVFEYLPTQTEMMGIGPVDGSAQEVMTMAQRDAMIDYDDKATMQQRIAAAYQFWKTHGYARKYTGEAYRQFAASVITGQLSLLLNSMSPTKAANR